MAAGVFAELVPTAMPFARALCVVLDYYLSEGRAARLAHVLSQVDVAGAAFDEAISEALGMCCSFINSKILLRRGAESVQRRHSESLTSGYGSEDRGCMRTDSHHS